MVVDCLSSAGKYRAHLAPVWAALPDRLRGDWVELDEGQRPTSKDAAVVASYVDMRAARRQGYRHIALLEHGIGQSYGDGSAALPGGRDRDPVGLFLSPNATAAQADTDRYPKAKAVVVGCPKLDTLPKRQGKPDAVLAVSFHWHYTRIPEMRSAFEQFRAAIGDLSTEFTVLGHAHPQAAGMVVPFYEQAGIEYVPNFEDVCRRADIYICDNSSTLYEFASTGRPVVVLNAREYRRDVEWGLRFWEASEVGINVDEPEQLAPSVRLALADAPAQHQARKRALAIAYGYPRGGAKRAAKALVEWLG